MISHANVSGLYKGLDCRNDSGRGIIGKENRELERYPNEIYWSGIKKFQLFKASYSRREYYEKLPILIGQRKGFLKAQKKGDEEYVEAPEFAWDQGLIPLWQSFDIESASFDLSFEEQHFIKDVVNERCSGSLLNFILENEIDLSQQEFPWSLRGRYELTDDINNALANAHLFSAIMDGAVKLYFLFCSINSREEKLISMRREYFKQWFVNFKEQFDTGDISFASFKNFFRSISNNRELPRTEAFLSKVFGYVARESSAIGLEDNKEIFELFKWREHTLKGPKRARLSSIDALSRWVNGRSAAEDSYQLSYRWSNVKELVSDIQGDINVK